MYIYKALNGQAPEYLTNLLKFHNSVHTRALRSTTCDYITLHVPRTKLVSAGDRAFAVAGPRLWNGLPVHIKKSDSLEQFKKSLKTHLFKIAFT